MAGSNATAQHRRLVSKEKNHPTKPPPPHPSQHAAGGCVLCPLWRSATCRVAVAPLWFQPFNEHHAVAQWCIGVAMLQANRSTTPPRLHHYIAITHPYDSSTPPPLHARRDRTRTR